MKLFVVACLETQYGLPRRLGFIERQTLTNPTFTSNGCPMVMDLALAECIIHSKNQQPYRLWFRHPLACYCRRQVELRVRTQMNGHLRGEFDFAIARGLAMPLRYSRFINVWPCAT